MTLNVSNRCERNTAWAFARSWLGHLLLLVGLVGCDPLYQSYTFTETARTTFPVETSGEEVWVTSVPVGADVYVQPFSPEGVPSHATAPEAHRGQTPLRLTLPPGSYWIELALDADVFEMYFTPPYDDAQFEQDGATSEALLFHPFSPGEKRRVLRYYRLDKQAQEGQTLIALFHPRGEPLERVMALYPHEEQYRFVPEELRVVLQRAQVPPAVQETFLTMLTHGGKAFWSMRNDYRVTLELRPQEVQGHIVALYTGFPLPDPLLPDGGGF